jgi:hypothetical protein
LVDDYIAVHITFLCSLLLAYEQWKSPNRSFHSYSNDINFVSKILDRHEIKNTCESAIFLAIFLGEAIETIVTIRGHWPACITDSTHFPPLAPSANLHQDSNTA